MPSPSGYRPSAPHPPPHPPSRRRFDQHPLESQPYLQLQPSTRAFALPPIPTFTSVSTSTSTSIPIVRTFSQQSNQPVSRSSIVILPASASGSVPTPTTTSRRPFSHIHVNPTHHQVRSSTAPTTCPTLHLPYRTRNPQLASPLHSHPSHFFLYHPAPNPPPPITRPTPLHHPHFASQSHYNPSLPEMPPCHHSSTPKTAPLIMKIGVHLDKDTVDMVGTNQTG